MKRSTLLILLAVLGAALLAAAPASVQVLGQSEPPVMPPSPRLTPPPTVYPPTQASLGAQVYFQVCMVCHGDRGQGLTDEWRDVLDPPDRNCWQSRCHASNHPPDGFIFPRYVPPVVGPGVVASFANAQQLHDFIKEKMPWQAPGSRSEEEYWQLTAYLLSANDIDPGPEPLSERNAAAIRMRPLAATATPLVSRFQAADLPWVWIAWGSVIGLSMLALLVVGLRRMGS